MDIHKPKPVHSWREFASEIGVIVIGVLIALSAEQAVEWFHWRGETAEAREAMDADLQDLANAAQERVGLKDCIGDGLDALRRVVEQGGARGRVDIRSAPFRIWPDSSWLSASSAGITTHLGAEHRLAYAQAFDAVPTLRSLNQQEFQLWTDLGTLADGKVRGDVGADRLLADISRLRGLNRIMAVGSGQLLDVLKRRGISPDADTLVQIRKAGCAARAATR